MIFTRCYASLILPFLFTSFLQAQTNTLNLEFDHVTIVGESLPAFQGAPIEELFVARYTSAWEIVPFQIDERDDASGSFFVQPDAGSGFDANDEITVMTKSVGNKGEEWFNNTDSQNFSRYEVEIINPIDGGRGYLYIFRSTSPPAFDNTQYVSYTGPPSTESAADTVVGETYKIANAENGFPNFMSIPLSAGGENVDLLEAQKVLIKSNVPGFEFNESDHFFADTVKVIAGNLLVRRELSVGIGFNPDSTPLALIPIPVNYYGYTVEIFGEFDIPEEISIPPLTIRFEEVRQTFNLTPEAVGMRLFSKNNSSITINGDPGDDIFDDTVEAGVNRLVYTGTQGTFVNSLIVPSLGDRQRLVFEEDGSSGLIGNAGFVLEADPGNSVSGAAPLGLTILFPGAISPGEEVNFTGTEPLELQLIFSEQTFIPTSITGETEGLPSSFALHPNFPNPFNPATTIRYDLPAAIGQKRTVLKIYNLLGQEIRTLVNEVKGPGFHTVVWDANDSEGFPVPSGLYVYRIQTGDFVSSGKMLFLK